MDFKIYGYVIEYRFEDTQILQNILENKTFQRIEQFVKVDSYEMDFMKG